jgi:hypothetical protein
VGTKLLFSVFCFSITSFRFSYDLIHNKTNNILLTLVQALGEASADATLSVRGGASASSASAKTSSIDLGLISYFALWYLGNYYVRNNKIPVVC